MGIFHKVKVGEKIISPIDWEMSPNLSFGTYESWGGRERVRNNNERVYYFFVDNWGEEPKLCLMERGVKHARILADITVPVEIVKNCVENQGRSAIFEKSYAIDEPIKKWLIENVLDGGDSDLVVPRIEPEERAENMGPPLPHFNDNRFSGESIKLPAEPAIINDDEIEGCIKRWNFFDAKLNPTGKFENVLVDGGQPETVIDLKTSLMWQRGGLDIASIRTMQLNIAELNRQGFAGFDDWRQPTMEEALSLMEPERNEKGIYLHPAFSREQPFIFVAAKRKPGGYWFVDYKQGRAFWSSGTIPGGFGRLVRTFAPE
ncbi:hypothetical protein DGMP_02720 [Desulfomarina profundi]|uniref:Lcl C-terminal domain-containing protein n=1 Tax=Desulfomarina profundi TaxID=2772557 RepID=A0A8D5FJZ6_9BACT|nr:DUF1566 domain-containing protein [Desulfomarina profundi]BCL59579.1 hypothetical protein DGMP_02720 [Desulfomarina profundi]